SPASDSAGSPGTSCNRPKTTNVANTTIGRNCSNRRPIRRGSLFIASRCQPYFLEFRRTDNAAVEILDLRRHHRDARPDILRHLQGLLDDEALQLGECGLARRLVLCLL